MSRKNRTRKLLNRQNRQSNERQPEMNVLMDCLSSSGTNRLCIGTSLIPVEAPKDHDELMDIPFDLWKENEWDDEEKPSLYVWFENRLFKSHPRQSIFMDVKALSWYRFHSIFNKSHPNSIQKISTIVNFLSLLLNNRIPKNKIEHFLIEFYHDGENKSAIDFDMVMNANTQELFRIVMEAHSETMDEMDNTLRQFQV